MEARVTDSMTRLKVGETEREEARKAADFLERASVLEHSGLFLTQANGDRLTSEMPPVLLRAMKSILVTLAETGEALLISPEQEVSPEKAAELLGVSRPLVYQRMDMGKLPYRQVGTHRRIRVDDVVALRASEDRRRSFATALSADTEDLEADHAPREQSPS
jgi:excisionase family DNA binding protein